MDGDGFVIKDKRTGVSCLSGHSFDGVYKVTSTSPATCKALYSALYGARLSASTWPARLGHPSFPVLRYLISRMAISAYSLSSFKNNKCHICPRDKATKLPFSRRDNISSRPFDLLFTDVWGPASTVSRRGYRFYLSIVDDCTRFTWIFLLYKKSDVSLILFNFIKQVEN